MKVWIRQSTHKLFHSYRFGEALTEGERVVVLCPETNNELINCSKAFFAAELLNSRIVTDAPDERFA